jgi:uncharacterized protein (TIGR03503 family)
MLRKTFFLIVIIVLAGSRHAVSETLVLPPQGDIRVLIDISGSMKKNDPRNLRQPALQLITRLLQDGNVAGVWTFGEHVNELIDHRKVDSAWRDEADRKARDINSVALFTNIGGVLEKSFDDFVAGKDYSNTHFILLTDGVVDISKASGVNVGERQRIISEVLPRFKQSGAKIHTIGLSLSADLGLLERLALDTGGIASVAKTSEDLTKVFLQAFDKASPAEEIPLEGNNFIVDSGIEEFTALVFRKPGSREIMLKEPSGNSFNAKTKPEYVNWFQDKGYDLITVKRPFEGEWELDAELDSGSRVTVVSNLRMVLDKLPANFFAGDQLQVRIGFFEDGQQVLDPAFLKLVDVDVTIRNEEGKAGTKRISDPAKPPADGLFRELITKLKDVGYYDVIVSGDGKTFKRQSRQRMQLSPPLSAELEATGSGEETAYRVVVRILSPNIDAEKSAIVAKIKAPDSGTIIKSLDFNAGLAQWDLAVEPLRGEGVYEVSLRVDGVTVQGGEFRFDPDVIVAEFPRQEASPTEYKSLVSEQSVADINSRLTEDSEKTPAPASDPDAAVEPVIAPIDADLLAAAQAEQAAATGEVTGSNWKMWLIIGVATGLTALLGGFGFWAYRRKKAINEVIEKRTAMGKQQDKLKPEPEAAETPKENKKNRDAQNKKAAADAAAAAAATAAAVAAAEAAANAAAEAESRVDLEDEIQQLEEPADDLEFDEPETEELSEAFEAESAVTEAEDIDEEFNLEDFDIGDTDDLPPDDNKK